MLHLGALNDQTSVASAAVLQWLPRARRSHHLFHLFPAQRGSRGLFASKEKPQTRTRSTLVRVRLQLQRGRGHSRVRQRHNTEVTVQAEEKEKFPTSLHFVPSTGLFDCFTASVEETQSKRHGHDLSLSLTLS